MKRMIGVAALLCGCLWLAGTPNAEPPSTGQTEESAAVVPTVSMPWVAEETLPSTEDYSAWNRLPVRVYHYCPCHKCCGKYADHPAYKVTKSGETAKEGQTIAVDPNVIPLGSTVIVEGHRYIAEDTGVHGKTVDIYVEDHAKARELGTYETMVIWK